MFRVLKPTITIKINTHTVESLHTEYFSDYPKIISAHRNHHKTQQKQIKKSKIQFM